jgi:hypothetical protein
MGSERRNGLARRRMDYLGRLCRAGEHVLSYKSLSKLIVVLCSSDDHHRARKRVPARAVRTPERHVYPPCLIFRRVHLGTTTTPLSRGKCTCFNTGPSSTNLNELTSSTRLRILYMPPIYAIISFFSYQFYKEYTYYSLVQVGAS